MNIQIKSKDNRFTTKKVVILILLPIILFLLGLYLYFFSDKYVSTDDAYLKSGKISISAEVQGKIKDIYATMYFPFPIDFCLLFSQRKQLSP